MLFYFFVLVIHLNYKMSMSSYLHNLELGVTGPGTSTCLPGAMEQIFPRTKLDPEDHLEYGEWVEWYNNADWLERYVEGRQYYEIMTKLLGKLGRISCEEAIFKRPQSLGAFTRLVNSAMENRYRVVLDLEAGEDTHAVALVRTRWAGYYSLVSTWIPEDLQRPVTTRDLYPRLAEPEYDYVPKKYWREDYPTDDYNVSIIPKRY